MQRRFLIWLALLVAVWMLANWPRDCGTLKFWIEEAGFPWIFASWERGRLVWFDGAALATDLGVLAGLVALAWLGTRPRNVSRPATSQAESLSGL